VLPCCELPAQHPTRVAAARLQGMRFNGSTRCATALANHVITSRVNRQAEGGAACAI
jgi:hypothetical protein